MATTLLQALQGGLANPLGSPTSPLAAPTPSGAQATQQVGDLLRAKTGRAVDFGSSSTPKMSTLAADSAASQATNQYKQIQSAGAAQAQQIGVAAQQQADQAKLATQQAQLATEDQKLKFANQASNLIQQYKQAGKQLDLDHDKAAAEQLGFLTRLSDDKYVTKLQQAGELQRLQDANNFQQATVQAVFGAQMDALKGRMTDSDILNMDANAWKEKMGTLDLNWAMQSADLAMKSANQQALYTGLGNLGGAGVTAYGDYKQGAFDQDYQDAQAKAKGGQSYADWQKTHP